MVRANESFVNAICRDLPKDIPQDEIDRLRVFPTRVGMNR